VVTVLTVGFFVACLAIEIAADVCDPANGQIVWPIVSAVLSCLDLFV
jgi:hypothetical protein